MLWIYEVLHFNKTWLFYVNENPSTSILLKKSHFISEQDWFQTKRFVYLYLYFECFLLILKCIQLLRAYASNDFWIFFTLTSLHFFMQICSTENLKNKIFINIQLQVWWYIYKLFFFPSDIVPKENKLSKIKFQNNSPLLDVWSCMGFFYSFLLLNH